MNKLTLVAVAFLGTSFAAFAEEMLTDANGMTLYTFDKDSDGVSACYDDCAVNWPPFMGVEGAAMGDGWTLVDRTDGTKQWAYDGMPMYFFKTDVKVGDKTGDGVGDVWHVFMEED